MNDRLRAISAQNGGYFTRAQALDSGHIDRELKAGLRAGVLVRLRHGVYAFADVHRALADTERHKVISYSVIDKLGPGVALSHTSASAAWKLDRFNTSEDVHVTWLGHSRGRHEAGVVFHEGELTDEDIVEHEGRLVVRQARAVVESALTSPIESGIVTANSALRLNLISPDELTEAVQRMRRWRGARKAMIVERISDGRCESIGESRSLYLFWKEALPKPDLQYEVRDSSGLLVARTDFTWLAYRHVGEFDGLVKYGRLNPYSTDIGRILVDEKLREDLVRNEDLGMSRWGWAGLHPKRSSQTAKYIREGLERSRRLYTRNRTYIPLG